MQKLTVQLLKTEAKAFADRESGHKEKSLFGVTDGKAVGTYLEHKFQEALQKKYEYARGSSAKGIDFPQLDIDIKVTSIRQPQSSCPFKSARQKNIWTRLFSLSFRIREDGRAKNTHCYLEYQACYFHRKQSDRGLSDHDGNP